MGLAQRIETPDEQALAVLHSLQGDSLATTDEKIDRLEISLARFGPLIDLQTEHVFTPGLVSRTIYMPAGTLLTSRIHRHEHQYAIMSGSCSVFVDGVGVEFLEAPFRGVTKPGSRRALYIHEDTVWATFHPCSCASVEEFEEDAFDDRKIVGDMSAHELHLSITGELRRAIAEGEKV